MVLQYQTESLALWRYSYRDTFLVEVPLTIPMIRKVLCSLAVLAVPATLCAQFNDGAFQVNYVSRLDIGDAVINVVNDGWQIGGGTAIPGNGVGDFCVNAYVYSPDQQLAACCTCLTTPNELDSWSLLLGPNALLSNATNTNAFGQIKSGNWSAIVKLLATFPNANDTCPTADLANAPIVAGLLAWSTHWHVGPASNPALVTETRFEPGNLSTGENARLKSDCAISVHQGSGSYCPGCRKSGGLAVPTPAL